MSLAFLAAGLASALLIGRRADDVLVGDDVAVALLLPLEIEIADAQRAGAVVDAKDAAFLFVPRRDEPVVARLLLGRAVAAAIADRDAEGAGLDVGLARIVGVLAGDDVAGQFVEPIDQREIDLRRREEFILRRRRRPGGEDRQGRKKGIARRIAGPREIKRITEASA